MRENHDKTPLLEALYWKWIVWESVGVKPNSAAPPDLAIVEKSHEDSMDTEAVVIIGTVSKGIVAHDAAATGIYAGETDDMPDGTGIWQP